MTSNPLPLQLRAPADADWPQVALQDARAFGLPEPMTGEELARLRAGIADADAILAEDVSRPEHPLPVGFAGYYRLRLSVPAAPGAAPRVVDAPGLSWVSVAATHKRRGVLRRLLTDLATRWRAEGAPVAILTASEATIYERFGFGPATYEQRVEVTAGSELRTPPGADVAVRFAGAAEAAEVLPDLHERYVRTHPGTVGRSPGLWAAHLADPPTRRDGGSVRHYLLHADGYASYRSAAPAEKHVIAVDDVFGITPAARLELWRALLALDLHDAVVAQLAPGDPLPRALVDQRAARVTGQRDSLWLRILDVPAALTARGYRRDIDVVLGVDDPTGMTTGHWRLRSAAGVVSCEPTRFAADVELTAGVLGSLYLGGHRATEFADAGRLRAAADVLETLDVAFSTPRAPYAGTFF